MIHANSLAAFHSELPRLSAREWAIYEWIVKHGPATDRQVMIGLGFTDMNAVRPRCTELIDANRLMEVGDIRCPTTGKMVRRLDIRRPRGQLALIE